MSSLRGHDRKKEYFGTHATQTVSELKTYRSFWKLLRCRLSTMLTIAQEASLAFGYCVKMTFAVGHRKHVHL